MAPKLLGVEMSILSTNLDGKTIWFIIISVAVSIALILSLILLWGCACCCNSSKRKKGDEGFIPPHTISSSRPPIEPGQRVSSMDPRYKTLRYEDSFQVSDRSVKDLRTSRRPASKSPKSVRSSSSKRQYHKVTVDPIPMNLSAPPLATSSSTKQQPSPPKQKSKSVHLKVPSMRAEPAFEEVPTHSAKHQLIKEQMDKEAQKKAEREAAEQRERDRLWHEMNRHKRHSSSTPPPAAVVEKLLPPPIIIPLNKPLITARTVRAPVRPADTQSRRSEPTPTPIDPQRKPSSTTLYLPPVNSQSADPYSTDTTSADSGHHQPNSVRARQAAERLQEKEKRESAWRKEKEKASKKTNPSTERRRQLSPRSRSNQPGFELGRPHHPRAPPRSPPPRGDRPPTANPNPNPNRSRIL